MKTKYTVGNEKVQHFNKNIKVNPINLDIMAQGGYGTFGFYVKLSTSCNKAMLLKCAVSRQESCYTSEKHFPFHIH